MTADEISSNSEANKALREILPAKFSQKNVSFKREASNNSESFEKRDHIKLIEIMEP